MSTKRQLILVVAALTVAAATGVGAWAQESSSGSPSGDPQTQQKPHGHSARVEAVQRALNEHGANLKVDGHMGKMTREALKKYQADNGLKASGRIDKATMDKLGVK